MLPVLGLLQQRPLFGPDFAISPRTAKWIARMRRWLPDDGGPLDYLMLANRYADRVTRGVPANDLDQIAARIAAKGWEDRKDLSVTPEEEE